jgi:hypothetical protein
MKKLIFTCLFLLAGFSQSAHAQGVGTYCSAKSAEGFWAMSFGPGTVAQNCMIVQRALRQTAGINNHHTGYYNINGVNRVMTRCGFQYRNLTTSIGGYALQNAVDTARVSGLSHCLFFVNSY